MEITQTIAAIAVTVAAATYAVSLIIALVRGREPKVVSRMAMRKQLSNTFMDIDWNLTEDDDFESAVAKTVYSIDMLGVAFEKAKADFEQEQERKRNEAPPVYQDPTKSEQSRKNRKKKGK